MISINMLSRADSVQGHGVLTAHDEQVGLIKNELSNRFITYENSNEICDINHFHTINLDYFLKLPTIKAKGIAVGHVHFLPETLEKSLKLPALLKEIFYKYVITFYKSMDYLVTVNPLFIDKLCEYGIERNKITYIPNFVSSDKFYKMQDVDKKSVKEKYNIAANKFTVLSVGQLQKRKGVFEFLQLAEEMPDIEFVWAGGFSFGKISDGYDEIKAAMENLPSNVKFIGIIDHDCMNELYNVSDVMFQPSFGELFPMTILEAMSCQIPLLLRDLPEYQPILNGHFLKGDSTEEFKTQIECLKDKVFYQQAVEMSKMGSEFYSKEKVKELWQQYYCEIYNDSNVRGHKKIFSHTLGQRG